MQGSNTSCWTPGTIVLLDRPLDLEPADPDDGDPCGGVLCHQHRAGDAEQYDDARPDLDHRPGRAALAVVADDPDRAFHPGIATDAGRTERAVGAVIANSVEP